MRCNKFPDLLVALAAAITLAANAQTSAPALSIPIPLPPPPVLKLQPLSVTAGTASINSTAGGNLGLGGGGGAIPNWDKFAISAGGTIRFAQPVNSQSILNRLLNDPRVINDPLSSNGRVGLLNPAGTVQQGEVGISVGGRVALAATALPDNGIITTSKGETILTAGSTVSLTDSATPGIKVDITGAKGNVTNLGTIMAEVARTGIAGGMVRNGGQPNVSSVVNEGGRLFLRAGPSGRTSN